MRAGAIAAGATAFLTFAAPSQAQLRGAFPDAGPVAVYSPGERAAALQKLLHSAKPPTLGAAVSVTPNAPSAPDGTHLSFWKPSFVLGTANGGEAGVNFWGLHNDGHINIGFAAATAKTYVLDCRLLSAGAITYKLYQGTGSDPALQGEGTLVGNHLLLAVPFQAGNASVELWPTPVTAVMGFLGCDLSPVID